MSKNYKINSTTISVSKRIAEFLRNYKFKTRCNFFNKVILKFVSTLWGFCIHIQDECILITNNMMGENYE